MYLFIFNLRIKWHKKILIVDLKTNNHSFKTERNTRLQNNLWPIAQSALWLIPYW